MNTALFLVILVFVVAGLVIVGRAAWVSIAGPYEVSMGFVIACLAAALGLVLSFCLAVDLWAI